MIRYSANADGHGRYGVWDREHDRCVVGGLTFAQAAAMASRWNEKDEADEHEERVAYLDVRSACG